MVCTEAYKEHIVNVKTIRGIKAITTYEGYKDLMIYPPSALLEEEDEDCGRHKSRGSGTSGDYEETEADESIRVSRCIMSRRMIQKIYCWRQCGQ